MNALGLAVIGMELAARFPDLWSGQFEDERKAEDKLAEIRLKREQMANALQLRFDAADAPQLSSHDQQDPWLLSSAGDLSLLTQPNARRAIYFYRKAAAQGDFILDAVRRQIQMFADLGVLEKNITEVLKILPEPKDPETHELERVLLFTGHRIDSSGERLRDFRLQKKAKRAMRFVR